MTKKVQDIKKEAKEREQKIEKFSDLLDTLDSVESKKKLLWKEAYENALNDRAHAGILLTDLMQTAMGSAANHSLNGPIMTKYIERMSKSNDQILRLAELLAKETGEDEISVDDIFNKIES